MMSAQGATEHRIPVEHYITDEGRRRIRLHLPNGKEKYYLLLGTELAKLLVGTSFETWTILGDYSAVLDKAAGVIEARVVSANRWSSGGSNLRRRFPGIQESPSDGEGDSLEESAVSSWRLPFHSEPSPLSVELSTATSRLAPLYPFLLGRESPSAISLKIIGITTDRHDEALTLLEELAGSLLFEMDLKYEVPLRLDSIESNYSSRRTAIAEQDQELPKLPRVLYPTEAVALYSYGRSALGLPLLEYLAYYQAIEYFFPTYVHATTLRKLKLELIDPRFNPHRVDDLSRVMALVSATSKGSVSERDQLKITLEECIREESLTDFLRANPAILDSITDKSRMHHIRVLHPKDASSKLMHQVADRIYDLRCRIVHSKEAQHDKVVPLLLPTGPEVKYMREDVDLMRFLARKVIVAGSRSKSWSQ